ncbi:hypothetical protein, partial [Pseudoalteromonas sp. MTN2-4]|uniref:hypothetical protein n=1 Tax=Pseudoalteromonas sp. MTN2-4 TaxID=3056555 RepID=UPI0036F1D31F
ESGVTKKLEVISKPDLEKMHTGTLMSRRNALLKCEESLELSDQYRASSHNEIEFKNTEQWKRAYQDIKAVLATRENIPNKQERKALRQAKAKQRR